MQRFRMYRGGDLTESISARWMDSENPFSGQVWSQVAQGTAGDADRAVQAAHLAFAEGPWSQLTASQRGLLLHKVRDLILRNARTPAEAEVQDSGLCDKIQGAVIPVNRKGFFSFTRHEPLGVVAALNRHAPS